jgi:hypothetical protein
MKTFGVVGEENKKSTRKKMPKIRLTLSIICHRYFDARNARNLTSFKTRMLHVLACLRW